MFSGAPKHHGPPKVPHKGNPIAIGVGHCIVIRFGPSCGVNKTKVQFFLNFEQNPCMEACIQTFCRPPCRIFLKLKTKWSFFNTTYFYDKIHFLCFKTHITLKQDLYIFSNYPISAILWILYSDG